MAKFDNEITQLKHQQNEAIQKLQAYNEEINRTKEHILKLQGAIEVLTNLNRDESEEGTTN